MENKSKIIQEFNLICLKHKTVYFNREDFQQFINGFYQAEGTAGVYFNK